MQIVLREYNVSTPLPTDVISFSEIEGLRKKLGNQAEILYDIDGIKIKACSHVGYIPIKDNVELVVLPKIEVLEDFFYILERANSQPKLLLRHNTYTYLDKSDRKNIPYYLMGVLMNNLISLKRDGLLKKSVEITEMRNGLKGKLDIRTTITHSALRGSLHKIHCRYHTLTVDTVENRFIKATLRRLLELNTVPKDIRKKLIYFWNFFLQVPMRIPEHFSSEITRIVRKQSVPVSRGYYIEILSLCLLIMENTTVSVRPDGDVRLTAFTIKMEDVFEEYIRNLLRDELTELTIVDGNKDTRKLFINAEKPDITPDVIIYKGLRCLLVADIKYKNKLLPKAEDWYQVISYSVALSTSCGILIVSSAEERAPRMYTTYGKRIWVYYFCLKDFPKQEKLLIDFISERMRETD